METRSLAFICTLALIMCMDTTAGIEEEGPIHIFERGVEPTHYETPRTGGTIEPIHIDEPIRSSRIPGINENNPLWHDFFEAPTRTAQLQLLNTKVDAALESVRSGEATPDLPHLLDMLATLSTGVKDEDLKLRASLLEASLTQTIKERANTLLKELQGAVRSSPDMPTQLISMLQLLTTMPSGDLKVLASTFKQELITLTKQQETSMLTTLQNMQELSPEVTHKLVTLLSVTNELVIAKIDDNFLNATAAFDRSLANATIAKKPLLLVLTDAKARAALMALGASPDAVMALIDAGYDPAGLRNSLETYYKNYGGWREGQPHTDAMQALKTYEQNRNTAIKITKELATVTHDQLVTQLKNTPDLLSKRYLEGDTLLTWAIKNEKEALISALLDAGVNPTVTDAAGNTPSSLFMDMRNVNKVLQSEFVEYKTNYVALKEYSVIQKLFNTLNDLFSWVKSSLGFETTYTRPITTSGGEKHVLEITVPVGTTLSEEQMKGTITIAKGLLDLAELAKSSQSTTYTYARLQELATLIDRKGGLLNDLIIDGTPAKAYLSAAVAKTADSLLSSMQKNLAPTIRALQTLEGAVKSPPFRTGIFFSPEKWPSVPKAELDGYFEIEKSIAQLARSFLTLEPPALEKTRSTLLARITRVLAAREELTQVQENIKEALNADTSKEVKDALGELKMLVNNVLAATE